jgi:hypothetical protein
MDRFGARCGPSTTALEYWRSGSVGFLDFLDFDDADFIAGGIVVARLSLGKRKN